MPVSISATRCSVGNMIGRPSVQPFSIKSRYRFSSVSGSSSRCLSGFFRALNAFSPSVTGFVRALIISSVIGMPVTGSFP